MIGTFALVSVCNLIYNNSIIEYRNGLLISINIKQSIKFKV